MTDYVLQQVNHPENLSWRYEFTLPNDKMAVDYATKVVLDEKLRGVYLFCHNDKNQRCCIASITLIPNEARVQEWKEKVIS